MNTIRIFDENEMILDTIEVDSVRIQSGNHALGYGTVQLSGTFSLPLVENDVYIINIVNPAVNLECTFNSIFRIKINFGDGYYVHYFEQQGE